MTTVVAGAHLAEALERHRVERADDLALAGGGASLSWRRLDEAVSSLAAVLSGWSVVPGSRLVLALPSSPQWVAAFLAAGRAGFVAVSAGSPRDGSELRAFCLETGAAGVLSDGPATPPARAVAAELGLGHVAVSDPLGSTPPAGAPAPIEAAPERVATLHFTSGSTGERKAVPRGEAGLVNEGRAIAGALELGEGPVLIVSPVFHSFGAGLLSAALLAGAPALLVPRYSAQGVLELISGHAAAVVVAVPYVFHCLARMRWARDHDVGSVRLGIAGGTPLHAATAARFRQRFGAPLAQEYGLSEVGVVSINVDDPEGRPWSVGRALPGLEASTRAPRPGAGDGELVIAAAPERDPDGTVTAEQVATGDAGQIDADGFIRITGRIKHMVNVGGVKVAPHDVERRLLAGSELEDVVVVAIPDALLGERVAAAAVPRAGGAMSPTDFHTLCRRALAPHEIPRRLLWLDSMPRLQSGKPDLQTIRRRLASTRR